MVKHKILTLKSEGKSLAEIAQILNCAKSTVYYHCSGYKERVAERVKSYRARNPLIRKLDDFNQSYKKKGIDNKIIHFKNRGNKESDVTLKTILEKVGPTPTCYLTGEIVNLSQPSTYSFDHKIPVSKGGDNSLVNLGLCTQDANMAKSDHTPEEFFELCKKVLIHNGYSVTKHSEVE